MLEENNYRKQQFHISYWKVFLAKGNRRSSITYMVICSSPIL